MATSLIPRDFIDKVIERNDIVEVITSFVPLKKRGQNFLACCPFHTENTPSLNVRQQKQYYHCFGCGASGNVITFLMEFDHMEFVEAINWLAARAGLELPNQSKEHHNKAAQSPDHYSLLQQASQLYQQQLRDHPDALRAVRYLKDRGLDGETAHRFQLGYAPAAWDTLAKPFAGKQSALIEVGMAIAKESGGCYDRFRDRIMFPIRDRRGRVIGFGGRVLNDEKPKYLNSPETPLFHKSSALYGLYEALQVDQKNSYFVIVEGYLDVIALSQMGVTAAVATLGTATSSEHVRVLLRYTDHLVFCFDGDNAGRKAAWRALETTLSCLRDGITIQFLFLPENDDPDTFIRQQGLEAWNSKCQSAQNLVDFFFAHLQQQADCQSVEGRSAFIKLASPLLAITPKCHLRELMIERMSRLLRIDLERLITMLQGIETPTQKIVQQPHRLPNRMYLTLALLIQNPSLGQHLLAVPNLSGNTPLEPLWQAITQRILENREMTTGALLESWRGHSALPLVIELANYTHSIPLDGIEAEFQGLLEGLKREGQASRVQYLMQLAASGQLNQEQRQELQEAIKRSKSPS